MNIFTANQVNHVYVMTPDSEVQESALENLGDVLVGSDANAEENIPAENIYFKHYGKGGITRSDLIPIKNIEYIKATPAEKMQRNLKMAKVTVNSEALDTLNPIAGQDYVLNIKFQNPMGMSPDNEYWKFAAARATSSMSTSDLYVKLALNLAKSMAREGVKLVDIYLGTSGDNVEVTAATTEASLSGTYTALYIGEAQQEWVLGLKQEKPLEFKVEPSTIEVDDEEISWADVEYSNGIKVTGGSYPSQEVSVSPIDPNGDPVVNSKLMADYEYFYMGERADLYRMKGWPNYVPTEYMVDPTYAYGYDTIAIHYSYTGSNHAVQKSEKDITFIVPSVESASGLSTTAQDLVDAINAIVYGESEEEESNSGGGSDNSGGGAAAGGTTTP